MQVHVLGYSDKLTRLLDKVIATLGDLSAVTEERFHTIVDDYRRTLESMEVRKVISENRGTPPLIPACLSPIAHADGPAHASSGVGYRGPLAVQVPFPQRSACRSGWCGSWGKGGAQATSRRIPHLFLPDAEFKLEDILAWPAVLFQQVQLEMLVLGNLTAEASRWPETSVIDRHEADSLILCLVGSGGRMPWPLPRAFKRRCPRASP
jgi:hypothetical protein